MRPECATVGVLLRPLSGRIVSMRLWSLAKVFHTCGKNCGKSIGNVVDVQNMAGNSQLPQAAAAARPAKINRNRHGLWTIL
jgi:hypothetical protein